MSSVRPDLKFADKSDESSFYKSYLRLPNKSHKTIRIADRGDYYTVLDDDAEFVADSVYKTSSVIKTTSAQGKSIKYITLSPAVFTNLIKLSVLNLGYKIEIYDKIWSNPKFASPGNLNEIEEFLNSSDLNSINLISSLKLISNNSSSDNKKIGLSFYDQNTKKIGLCEFNDNELFSNLESVLIQLGIKECLLPSNGNTAGNGTTDPDFEKLEQLIDRCDIVITHIKPSEYNDKNIEQDLVRLTGNDLILSTNELSSMKISLTCCNSLINYLGLINDEINFGNLSIYKHSLSKYMKLDYAAVKALNLFPNHQSVNNSMNKNSSLFGLLNNCKSIGGSRLLSQWLKQPLLDIDKIKERQVIVGHLINDLNLRNYLQNSMMNSVPDIPKLIKKLYSSSNKSVYSSSKLDDVIRLYQLSIKLPELLEMLQNSIDDLDTSADNGDANKDNKSIAELFINTWIKPIKNYIESLLKFQELIETTIDLSVIENATSAATLNSNSMISINPEFDENLLQINEMIQLTKDKISQIHQDTSDDLNMEIDKKLKLENHHVHGWCFRLTRTDSNVLRGNKNYKELSTVKAGIYFTTSSLSQLSSQINEYENDYKKVQETVVKEIITISSTYSPIFINLNILLSKLDVLNSFAHVSSISPIPYIRPERIHGLDDKDRVFKLKDSRHPCLEAQDDITFIANDIELVKDNKEFSIITGPNMGGKSTYIRQIGVIALMVQIGCFIPASDDDDGDDNSKAEVSIFDSILARVGASDSQLKGVSTFMAEMLEMSSILKVATTNSLIIVDELGRGTSTYDGFGLAWSISEYISKEIRCFTLFATHFHELTSLNKEIPTVFNLRVVAHIDDSKDAVNDEDKESITLLYKVEPGISDQSFGIHVAEVVKFPQKIISMAKRKASELDEYTGLDDEEKKKLKSEGDNDDELDPYTKDQRSNCTNDEILSGNEILKEILKQWKQKIELKGGLNDLNSSNEAVNILKNLINDEYKDKIKNENFIKEVLRL
ncbi:hypothetical protein BVG19_g631 [[Candida] boidinii]|nr:hypothetical protein BVG19_g631 [[Candida] boidinii]OWB54076.1 hypothetical protein B5S27_g5705 [[Candida] boidinii]